MDAYPDVGLGHLGDPTRRRIFELLAHRPSTVGELARQLPVSRPAVSQHLKVLKEAGLIRERRQGTRRLYVADPQTLGELRTAIEAMWRDALAGMMASIDKEESK